MGAIAAHRDGVTIAFQVQPRASRTGFVSEADGRLRLRVAAPPVDGAANREVVTWLARQLKVRKSDIQFLSGERARTKVVLVHGCTPAEVRAALDLA